MSAARVRPSSRVLVLDRQQRVLRRHMGLLDFVMRAAMSHARWLPAAGQREALQRQALARWYGPRTW